MLSIKSEGALQMDGNQTYSLSEDIAPRFGLYIHWPFCLSKCPYCDFNSHVRDHVDQAAFRAAYVRAIEYYAQITSHLPLSSIFFGGGTPSLMPAETVQTVIDTAQKNWRFNNDIEITLEGNPTSIEAAKFEAFRLAGVNRVSLGVQSLRDDDLKILGREHSAAEARKAIDIAQNTFQRTSFDLIYGRQDQTVSQWEAELAEAIDIAGEHLSLYQLTIEPGTAYHTRFQRGEIRIPDDELAAEFYELTDDMTAAAGLPAYEVSNHARPGAESRHNLIYWQYGQYAGIGPGAHGRIEIDGRHCATRAHRAPEIWRDKALSDGHGTHPNEHLTPREKAEEALMMGLRLVTGICKPLFQARTGLPLDDILDEKAVQSMVESGFLIHSKNRLTATPQGRLCLNALLSRIIN